MSSKFDNLINDTFAELVQEVTAAPAPEEVANNPDLLLQQQAVALKASGRPLNPKEKEVVRKAEELEKSSPQKSAQILKDVEEKEEAEQDIEAATP
jgi:hypothetical protein